jgi:F0F1-type ATP synthase assembly protein I
MVLPGLGGYWLDRQLHSEPWLTILGFAGGLALGMWHLIKMTSARPSGDGGAGTNPDVSHDDPSRNKESE